MYFNINSNGTTMDLPPADEAALTPQHVKLNSTPTAEAKVSQQKWQSDHLFDVSSFKGVKDTWPTPKKFNWLQLTMNLSKHTQLENKMSARAWSPCLYKPNTQRGNKNVDVVTLAVLDIDNGTNVEELIGRLNGIACFIHSSYGHKPEQPKYRVIVPLSQPVKALEWPETWARIDAWLGQVTDPSTKDPARIYFLPSCPVGSTCHFSKRIDGDLLDVNKLPELKRTDSNNDYVKAESKTNSNKVDDEVNDKKLGSKQQLIEVQKRCHFIQWACEPNNQTTVSEPQWTALLSNLGRFQGGVEAAIEGSKHHPDFDEADTKQKLNRLVKGSGPITCKRIQGLGFEQCPSGGCKLSSGKVTESPAGLGSWGKKKDANNKTNYSINKSNIPDDLKTFLDSNYSNGLMYLKGSFYGYKEGYWPRLEEQSEIRKPIAEMYGKDATPTQIRDLLQLCKDFQSVKEDQAEPNRQLICLANGTLDVESGQLVPNSPSFYLRTKSSISWDAEAKCERWLRFLDEIFINDEDKQEKIAFLQMWFGYCLVPDNTQHKFLWLIGSGGNGKSVLLDVLRALLGPQNVSDAHIERLGEKFVRAELEGKLVNISPEMGADATIADGYLKAIVAGDVLEAERKYQPSFSFRPFVRLIASTNNLPRLQDLTNGFFRRAVIMSFNRIFTSEEADKGLVPTLIKELPGILIWSVAGLKILREKGSFDIPSSSAQIIANYKHESDSVSLFASDCLAEDLSDKGMPPAEVYQGYREWAKLNGYGQLNIVNFGRRLSALNFNNHRSGGKTYWRVRPVSTESFRWDYSYSLSCPTAIFSSELPKEGESKSLNGFIL